MSLPTTIRIVDGLVTEGFITLLDRCESTKGRPRSLLEFNANTYLVIGVDLTAPDMVGEICSLAGEVQHEIRLPYEDVSPEEQVGRLTRLIDQLLEVPLKKNQKLRGIGIGVPGTTTHPEGAVIWAPFFGWRNVPLREILTAQYGLPIFIEHDVHLAALGELGFGAGIGARNIVCIVSGTGIGAGLIIDGSLHRGSNHFAGEIATMAPSVDFLGRPQDRFGPLGNLISGKALAGKALEYGGSPAEVGDAEEFRLELLIDAAREGAGWARRVLEEATDYLALMIANMIAVLDPEIIILGGGLSNGGDLLIEPIRRRVTDLVARMPNLVCSPLHRRGVALGAVMLVLNTTTDHTVIRGQP
jgi:predicted NBD/HSP70 family sugar kinase